MAEQAHQDAWGLRERVGKLEELPERVAILEERSDSQRRATDAALAQTRWLWGTLIALASLALLVLGMVHK